jgi:hypothetical protein
MISNKLNRNPDIYLIKYFLFYLFILHINYRESVFCTSIFLLIKSILFHTLVFFLSPDGPRWGEPDLATDPMSKATQTVPNMDTTRWAQAIHLRLLACPMSSTTKTVLDSVPTYTYMYMHQTCIPSICTSHTSLAPRWLSDLALPCTPPYMFVHMTINHHHVVVFVSIYYLVHKRM